ncbi:MAG: tetratricopeptide repeat protein [Halioglobus sp.]
MFHISTAVKAVAVSGLLLLGGCSIYSTPGDEPVPVESKPEYTTVTPPQTPAQSAPAPASSPQSTSAYQGLLGKAEQASAVGDYEQALALLERAQRIDPDSAEIYLSLAKTHQAKGDNTQASATAERGLLYCSDRTQCDALRSFVR